MKQLALDIPLDEVKKICKKWKIQELSVFGSILRDDFNPQKSDIDMLYVFSSNAHCGWEIVNMENDFEKILGRKVDLFSKKAIQKSKNPYKQTSILGKSVIIYEAT